MPTDLASARLQQRLRAFLGSVLVAAAAALVSQTAEAAPSGELESPEKIGESEIRVGDLLQAVREVSLDEAVLAAGSKVTVSARRWARGVVVLDVALADGHVVRGVPADELRKNFRRVDSISANR